MEQYLTPPYLWLGFGLLLVAAETVVPGVHIIWFGLAALVMALVSFLLPDLPGWWQVAIYAVLALGAAGLAYKYLRKNPQAPADNAALNRRVDSLVGRKAKLSDAIEDGTGAAFFGDTLWTVKGKDAPAGSTVEVVAIDVEGVPEVKVTKLPSA
jgi:membrane protein implicated in regulation of membrane protease activity